MVKKKILCVEDNPTNMLLVSRIVGAERHELIEAGDGLEALRILENECPDMILLDINIPGINGLDLARKIRGDDRFALVPIIATTANVLLGDQERCLEAGCNDYLPKPLDIRILRQTMRRYLNGSEEESGE